MKSNTLRRVFAAGAASACLIAPGAAIAQEVQPYSLSPTTASGQVTTVLGPGLAGEALSNGTQEVCEYWQIGIKTGAGQETTFHVESPASGSSATGFTPINPNTLPLVNTLKKAQADGNRATVAVSYVPSQLDCNTVFTNFVTSASLTVTLKPSPKSKTVTSTGVLKSLSSPSRISERLGNGTIKRGDIWRGVLVSSGKADHFIIDSGLKENFRKTELVPTNPKVTRWIENLRKAQKDGQEASVTIKYKTSEVVLGKTRKDVATGVSVKL